MHERLCVDREWKRTSTVADVAWDERIGRMMIGRRRIMWE